MTQVCGDSLAEGTDIKRFMMLEVTTTHIFLTSFEFERRMHFIGV